MTKWPIWDDLIALWKIEDSQLYNFLKKNLQPYNKYTRKKYVDEDSLERSRKHSFEFMLASEYSAYEAGKCGPHFLPRSDAEIYQAAREAWEKQSLEITNPPKDCHIISYTLSLSIEKAKQQIVYARENFIFEPDNVLKVAKEQGLPLQNETIDQRTAKEEEAIFPCMPGTRWEDITLTLIADNMVIIKTPQCESRFTYHELEMSDKRAGDKPTMLWELLKLFAKNQGFISSQNPNYDPKLPDTAKRLNKHLKGLFGINETIYTGHYKKEKGYRTKIKFYDRTF